MNGTQADAICGEKVEWKPICINDSFSYSEEKVDESKSLNGPLTMKISSLTRSGDYFLTRLAKVFKVRCYHHKLGNKVTDSPSNRTCVVKG